MLYFQKVLFYYNTLTKTSPYYLIETNSTAQNFFNAGQQESQFKIFFMSSQDLKTHTQSYLCLLILLPHLSPSPGADILDRCPSQEHHSSSHSALTAAKTRCLLLQLNIRLSSGILYYFFFLYFNRKTIRIGPALTACQSLDRRRRSVKCQCYR